MDRKEHWEHVYQNKSPLEVSWYQGNPALSLRLIGNAGLDTDSAVIDVGGGASMLVDKLSEAGFTDISVLDVSANALAHAKQRLLGKAGEVSWFEQDVTGFKPSRQYDLWHDRAVFHFLISKKDRELYVASLKKGLKSGGHLIIMAFASDGPVKCSGLEVVQYDASKLMMELGPDFVLVEKGYEIHKTPAGHQQKFAYFRLTHTPE